MEEKALAIIEEKKLRIRKQTEHLQHEGRQRGRMMAQAAHTETAHAEPTVQRKVRAGATSTSPASSARFNSNQKSPRENQYYNDHKWLIQSQIATLKQRVERKYERYMGTGVSPGDGKQGSGDKHISSVKKY